jgi:hypothetical protein
MRKGLSLVEEGSKRLKRVLRGFVGLKDVRDGFV